MSRVKALHNFDGSGTDQGLSLVQGEIVNVLAKQPTGWWKGKCASREAEGWFPASYVQEIPDEPVAPPAVAVPPPPMSTPPTAPPAAAASTAPPVHPSNAPPPPPSSARPPIVHADESPYAEIGDALTPSAGTGVPPPKPASAAPSKPMSPPPGKPSAAPPKPPGAAPPKPMSSAPPAPKQTRGSYFEEVGPQQNLPPVQGNGFCDNFWNDKGNRSGFDILVLKHRNGKEVLKELSEFMKQRAAVEDGYAKALTKLSHFKNQYSDLGQTGDAWNAVRSEITESADSHLYFSELYCGDLRATDFVQLLDLEKKVMSFKDSQKGTRKQYEAKIAERRKSLSATVPNVEKLHKEYCDACIEAKRAVDQANLGHLDHMSKRDYSRVVDTADKASRRQEDSAATYKKALESYNTTQYEWINEMLLACKEFEDAEVSRIEFLKTTMRAYADAGLRTAKRGDHSFGAIHHGYDTIAPMKDIATFAAQEGTGQDRPKPFPFASPAVIVENWEKTQKR